MTLSILENASPDGDFVPPKPVEYHYDLRLEIAVKEANRTIPVVAIFHDLVKHMKTAADVDKPLVVLTATDQLFFEHKEMTSDEFKKAFKVDEIKGKSPKVVLGFKLRTMTKLYDMKQKILTSYLQAHDLFLREHVGGFTDGIKTYSYGFLIDDHPDHPDIQGLQARFQRWMLDAWKKMDKDDKNKWKEELPQAFQGGMGLALPVNFSKDRISAEAAGQRRITTTALMVSTPFKYGNLLRVLLDSAVLNKKINNLIPLAFYKEDPTRYYDIVVNQDQFMANHRNIPILNIPYNADDQTGAQGTTLLHELQGHKFIRRVSYDHKQQRYHISTAAHCYRDVHVWIGKLLHAHKFPFEPTIRPLKFNGPNNQATKYSSVLSAATSVATKSSNASTIKTNSSTAWRQRPPLNISYSLDTEAFPSLPKSPHKISTTPSTTSETLDEDTIQSAISAALMKLEAQHKADLAQLKKEMDEKLAAVQQQMIDLSQQVAMQTYQALIQDDSPIVTKTDHAHLQHEINVMSTQLTTLIQMLQQGSNSPVSNQLALVPILTSPPRTTKRAKPSMTPEKPSHFDDLLTQDTLGPSAASFPEEGEEGCEL